VLVSVPETIGLYGLVPLAVLLAVSLLAARKGLSRRPRDRPGEPWNYPPVWWTANPQGAGLPDPGDHENVAGTRGGAQGDW
jgi:hypothetical protein